MPKSCPAMDLSPQDRLCEVASILARGAARWRREVKAGRIMHASANEDSTGIGLEQPAETILSVSPRTRRLAMRDDGDAA